MEEVLDTPMQPHQWAEIADEFSRRWNLPHCVGAVDGKHVAIRKPKKGGSVFWNYKGYNSVVLMAMVDADYKFRWVQVGDPGSYSDGQIWKEADLKVAIERNVAGLSDPSPVPADNQPMPFFLVGWSTEPHPGCRRSGSQRCSWGVETEGVQMDDCQRVQGGNRDTREAKKQRNLLKHYFQGPGVVDWQERMI